MKLGARILKTGIAIVLALYIGQLLNAPSPVFAAIAAIFAIQPTIYRSYLTIIEQIQGNIIGAVLAVIFVLVLGSHFIVIGLAAIIVIALHLKFKLENTIGLSLVTLISIMETSGGDFIQFAGIRFSTIMVGVFSAFIVNLVFMPPKYETKLYNKFADTTDEIIKWIRLCTRRDYDHTLLKNDVEQFKKNIGTMEMFYNLFKEERSYLKKNNIEKSRKLVIYRQMLITDRKALDILKKYLRFENELQLLPEPFRKANQELLDTLTYHHEQLMLRFIGKVPPPTSNFEENISLSNQEVFKFFLDYKQELDDESSSHLYHMMQMVAAIIDYSEQVEHLEKLITSFQSFHQNEILFEENGD